MISSTSTQSLLRYSVVHLGHLLTLNCPSFTKNGKRLKQTVNRERKNILERFKKELEVGLLQSIKTVVSHLKPRLGVALRAH